MNRELAIADGIRSVQKAAQPGVLSCVTFTDVNKEHWLKYDSLSRLNFDWPFARQPDSSFELSYLIPLISWKRLAWIPDTSASYQITSRHPDTLARVIDSIFSRLYELPKDFAIQCTIEPSQSLNT